MSHNFMLPVLSPRNSLLRSNHELVRDMTPLGLLNDDTSLIRSFADFANGSGLISKTET